jgi:hypothetical protein
VGVGPGVNIDSQRDVRKEAMLLGEEWDGLRSGAGGSVGLRTLNRIARCLEENATVLSEKNSRTLVLQGTDCNVGNSLSARPQ